MIVIEDHCWVVDWIYANFRPPVQATEAKRLYKTCCVLQCSIFADSNDTKSNVFQTVPTFQAVSRWTWIEGHIRQCYNLQGSLCQTIRAFWHGVRCSLSNHLCQMFMHATIAVRTVIKMIKMHMNLHFPRI